MPDEQRPPRPGDLPSPRKRYGQHFLTDRQILGKIARAVAEGASPNTVVIEIGPGRGALTDELVELGLQVIAIEIDRDLVHYLRERYHGAANVRIVEGDVLTADLPSLAGGPYRLIGNLPYYITTPIIFKMLVARPRAECAVFLIQREVADRLLADAGSDAYGALTVNVRSVASVELIGRVRAGAFRPPPKVDSAVVRLTSRTDPDVEAGEEEDYRRFVVAAFGQRRKQMRRVLRQIADVDAARADALLREAGIDAIRRPETLTPPEFARLLRVLGGGGELATA